MELFIGTMLLAKTQCIELCNVKVSIDKTNDRIHVQLHNHKLIITISIATLNHLLGAVSHVTFQQYATASSAIFGIDRDEAAVAFALASLSWSGGTVNYN